MAKQGTGTKQKTVAGAIMTGTMADKVANLRAKRAQVELGGGMERIEKQRGWSTEAASRRWDCLRGTARPILAWPARRCLRMEW